MDDMIEERHRDDGFEVTFVVSTPRDIAWERLATATPASDAVAPPGPGQWWIPAVEGAADEIEVVPQERLHVRKARFPCEGTEIVVTMEDAGTGTRITFVQHGFGPHFAEGRPWLEAGWWAIRADLYVFFEHGVACGRHLRPWSSIGCDVAETPGGLTVGAVQAGGLADQAGATTGDLILTIAGAPVVNVRELAVLVRARRPGTETKLRYLRERRVLSGSGTF
jgi:PDZ domain